MKGSIDKRVGKSGKVSWYGIVDLPSDPLTGKRRQKRVSAPTKRGCEAKALEALQAAQNGGTGGSDKLTVREYLGRWLSATEASIKPSTHRKYADTVRLHIVPTLGGVRLSKLSPLDLQRLYEDRLDSGLSPTTVQNLHAMLHCALDKAVRWNLLPYNPTERVDSPRRATPEMQTWDAHQVAAVLSAADDDPLEAMWRLVLMTGMRRGELLGLMWQDIDLDRGVLAVRRTMSRGKGGSWELGTPKSASGRRSIALPDFVVESLRAHRVRQVERRLALGPVWQDSDFVFTNETGASLHVNSLSLRFRQLIERAGVPRIRFHDCRHTSATLLLARGVHPKIVQERLGHANVSMTLDRYSHVTMDMQRQAADGLDAAFRAAS